MFSKKGFWINFEGDRVCILWFWSKDSGRYYSEKYNHTFYSISEYLKHVGSIESNIHSNNILSYTYSDLISVLASSKFRKETIVILHNIDIMKKPVHFWNRVPSPKRVLFNNDVIILICKDLGQAKQIIDSVDSSFADALGFKGGELVYWNNDN